MQGIEPCIDWAPCEWESYPTIVMQATGDYTSSALMMLEPAKLVIDTYRNELEELCFGVYEDGDPEHPIISARINQDSSAVVVPALEGKDWVFMLQLVIGGKKMARAWVSNNKGGTWLASDTMFDCWPCEIMLDDDFWGSE